MVSVIIPLYNKADYVLRALESVAAQTYKDFQVVIVDDGSSDGSCEIAEEFIGSHTPQFRLVRQANSGPGSARNRGLEDAQGELVAFLDADDEWLPDFLATALSLLESSGSAVASVSLCWREIPDQRGIETLWQSREIEGIATLSSSTPPLKLVHWLASMHSCTTLARTGVVREMGGFCSRDRCNYGEDAHLWLKVLLNYPVAFGPKVAKVLIHIDASELSHRWKGRRSLEPFLQTADDIEDRFCPPALKTLLGKFMAIRGFKTACVWAVTGYGEDSKALRQRFLGSGRWKLPYYFPSLVLSFPVTSMVFQWLWRARTGLPVGIRKTVGRPGVAR
jgi:glycosyltransferase involved in cell wall biosynthesis